MKGEMARQRKCDMCGVKLVVMLSDSSNANGDICLECSGASLEDFMEEGFDEFERVDEMRTFHGKSQYD